MGVTAGAAAAVTGPLLSPLEPWTAAVFAAGAPLASLSAGLLMPEIKKICYAISNQIQNAKHYNLE